MSTTTVADYPLGLAVDRPFCQVVDVIYRVARVDRGGGGFKGPTTFLGLGMVTRPGQVEHSHYIAMLDPNVASLISVLRVHYSGQDASLYRRLGITRQDDGTWAALTFAEVGSDGRSILRFGTAPDDGGWTGTAEVILNAAERRTLIDDLEESRK